MQSYYSQGEKILQEKQNSQAQEVKEAPFINFDWLESGFTVLPIQMFNWISRPQHAFHINAAAAGAVIIILTAVMNGVAIKLRYNVRKKIKW